MNDFKHTRILCLLSFFGLLAVHVNGQWDAAENLPVYPSNEVTTIRIELNAADLELLYFTDSLFSNFEYPATFIFESALLTDTVENVGFRLRGNTSRLAAKKSFKVSFNTFMEGFKWNDLEKLNLNGEHNDPSIMRSKIGWEMAHEAGLIAPYVSYTRLYINDAYVGLYVNVEHYDEQFLEHKFGSNAGNLYKCHYPANLNYISNDPEDYKVAPWNGVRTYELKTNTIADDYSGLAHFIDVLNNTPTAQLHCELSAVFDIQKYLRTVAFELVIGHWDGYVFNNNNFYLYQRPSDGKFEFIEYDIDNTAGIDWFGIDWTTRDIYNYNSESRPLYERLLENETLRSQFSYFIYQFMTEIAPLSAIESRANELLDLIMEAALEDEYRTLDYGFSNEDFTNSLTEAWGEHVDEAILPYFEGRFGWNYVQLETTDEPILFDVTDNAPIADGVLQFEVEVPLGAASVFATYSVDNGPTQTLLLNDEGVNGDDVAGDDQWHGSINLAGLGDFVEYTIGVTSAGVTAEQPCPTKVWISFANDQLVINELMSDNQGFVTDEFGDFDDWFELWNGNGAPVLPENYWVTDDLDVPYKFNLNGAAIPTSGFKLLWADQEEEEGPDHVNFRLSNNGEQIVLMRQQDGVLRLVDIIEFGPVAPDASYGRETDGSPVWITFETPTPNSENGIVHIAQAGLEETLPYPNPTEGLLHLSSMNGATFFDISGKPLNVPIHGETADLSQLPAGVYLLKSEGRIIRILKK